MTKLKGSVGIINEKDDPSLNALKGDVVAFEHGLYNVKLRGTTTDTVLVRLPKQNLVKLNDDAESMRAALLKAVESQPSVSRHLQQRLETMQLEDEFSYLVKRHTNPSGFDPLPEREANCALVRFMQAYYIGKGSICTGGRQLTSFYLALSPFYSHLGGGRISPLIVGTTGDAFNWCQQQFEKSGTTRDALLVVKAFAYVQHRLDFVKENHDALLDAFCVSMYLIDFLKRRCNDDGSIQDTFRIYGSQKTPSLDRNQVLWCFCRVFLNLAIHVRNILDNERQYNVLFPDPYSTTVMEQTKIAKLIVSLRPDCPTSHLAAYVSHMDTKDFVDDDHKYKYMKNAYELAVSGKEVADCAGETLCQYIFHMIVAYWLPTSACETACTVGEIRERMRRANEFMEACESFVPSFLFFQGKQHEKACKAALNAFKVPNDMVVPKMDAYVYSSVRFEDKYYAPGGKYDRFAGRYRCASCSTQLLKTRSCARCGKVYYCSKECQKSHWRSSHKGSCVPKGSAKM